MQAASGQLKDVFDLALNTTLAWSDASGGIKGRAPGSTKLQCRTDVRLKIRLPPPFTRVPRPVVQGAFGLVMKFVGNAILPRFAGLLESDYQRWCNPNPNPNPNPRAITSAGATLALTLILTLPQP